MRLVLAAACSAARLRLSIAARGADALQIAEVIEKNCLERLLLES